MRDPWDLMDDPLITTTDTRRRDDSPEVRLFAAILEDVHFCLARASLVDRETRREAAAWVRGEVDSIAPCSFREVCDILDLDEAATRARLLALGTAHTPAPRRRLDALLRAATSRDLPQRPATHGDTIRPQLAARELDEL